MRTITIPKKYGFPTLNICINGKKYTVETGKKITIEDHVAEAVENAMALAPKIGVRKSKLAQIIDNTVEEITAEDLSGISTISQHSLCYRFNLKKITIPENIEEIDSSAFHGCTNLKEVYLPTTPPKTSIVYSSDPFEGCDRCAFYFKTQASLNAYMAHNEWAVILGDKNKIVKSNL